MAIKVTTMIGDNYGSALQAYARQQVIKEIGGGASVVNLRPKSYVVRFLRTYLIPTKYDGIRKKLKKAKSDYKNRVKRKKVHEFYNKYIEMEIYRTLDELQNVSGSQITFICGSDQIWNPQFQPNRLFYLDFPSQLKIKKYSYAASLAVSSMSEEQKAYYRQKLDGFETISVREKTGKQLLEEATNKSVRVDVDPVLLLDTEKWKNVMSSRFNGKKYMLLYMLRPMPELLEFAKNVAHKKNLDLLYIGDYFIDDNDVESCHDAGVEDFLSAIYSAEYIVTNSFHATVFSILFKKMFCSYAVSRTGTRVQDFLQDVGLQKCQLENFNSAQFEFYSETDWNAVFAHIASQRETSMKYVEQIVRQDK